MGWLVWFGLVGLVGLVALVGLVGLVALFGLVGWLVGVQTCDPQTWRTTSHTKRNTNIDVNVLYTCQRDENVVSIHVGSISVYPHPTRSRVFTSLPLKP